MLFNILKAKNTKIKWPLYIVAIFLIIFLISLTAFFIFEKIYENQIYPRTTLGDIKLSGLMIEEAKKLLNKKIDGINQEGINLVYNDQKTTILPIISSFGSDLVYQIISFNSEKTIDHAFNIGRGNNFFINLENKIKGLIFGQSINLIYKINDEDIIKTIKENYEKFEIPFNNAELIATSTEASAGQEKIIFSIREDKIGKAINYEKAINELKTNLANLNISPIKLLTKTQYPTIKKSECLNIESQAHKIISLEPLTLKYGDQQWIINNKDLSQILALNRNKENKIIVGLDRAALTNLLKEKVAAKIDKDPINARFEITKGKVTEFQVSKDGLRLNIEASINKIEDQFTILKNNLELGITSNQDNASSTINLIAEVIKSTIHAGDINNLGIKEIIGTGHSNFAYSPPNRRHNIGVGAGALNGLLIKAGEEFSLIKALGDINAVNGYLPELVIKGNRTIPEYGGGLCQIGTTMFRTALASGLPITARRHHSYRVSYYEPAGTDAAVYDPWPDVRFINDTNKQILIQARIEGDDIYFNFWGTEDGRIAEQTKPIIYNIVKPPPTKTIETLDLPIGQKKCTERAHNGADAYFDYIVTYPPNTSTSTPEKKEERFESHYVPWQEVCLIGVEKLSDETASSTEDVLEED
ncbi:MAG: VanW family protein [Patescibacteria group bacterium]